MTKFITLILVFIVYSTAYCQTNFATVTYGNATFFPQEIFFGGPDETYSVGNCQIRGTINGEITWTGYCYTPNTLFGGASPLIANTFLVGKNGNIWKNESCAIFGSWNLQTSGVTDTLYSVKFFSIDSGFVVGDNGRVLRTFDNGRTWTVMTSGVTESLRRIIYTPDRTLFAVGDNGTLIYSNDAALSWSVVATGTNENFTDISFAGNDTGFITGYNGLLLKSVDKGLTWSPLNSGTTLKLNAVDFTSSLTGYTASDSLRMTTDGGLTWTGYQHYLYNPIIDVKFRDALNGYFMTQDRFFRTYDGGLSWYDMGQDLQTVVFPTNDIGYAAGYNVFRTTTDGGMTWTQTHPFNGATIYDAFFFNTDTGYVSGTSGSIYKTTDGGVTWTQQVSNTTNLLRSIHFHNQNDGIAVGSNWTTVRTNDGGLNWTATSSPNPSVYGYHDIFFLDSNLGYRCGSQGSITKTTDGGATFTTLTSGTADYLLKIYFLDMLKGFAVGEDGLLLKTVNGGVSWAPVNLPSTPYFSAIEFRDSLYGIIAGEGGAFYETSDGGNSWVNKGSSTGTIYDITFSDAYHGYLVGALDYRAKYSPVKGLDAYATACKGSSYIRPVMANNLTVDSGNVFLFELDTTGSDFMDAIVIGAVQSDTSQPYLSFKIPQDIKAGIYSTRVRTTGTSPVSTSIVTRTKINESPVATISFANDTLFTPYHPGYIYQWRNGFTTIPGATFSFLPVTQAGDYNVSVKYGCCTDGYATFTISDCNGSLVTAPVVSSEYYTCDSMPVVLSASGAQQYHWYESDTSTMILSSDSFYVTPPIASPSEDFYVTAVYGNCESDRILVRVYVVNKPSAPSVNPVTVCENEGVYLFSSGSALNWYTDTTSAPVFSNNTFYYAADPSIPVYVTSFNYSCESDFYPVPVTLINAPVSQLLTGDTAVIPFQTASYYYSAAVGNTVAWNVSGGTYVQYSDSIVVSWGNAGSGTVTVSETNSSGCESVPVLLIIDIDIANSVDMPDISAFNIYPNPAGAYIIIESTGNEKAEFILYNPLGQLVLNAALSTGGSQVLINLIDMQAGLYHYKIYSGNKIQAGKLVILE